MTIHKMMLLLLHTTELCTTAGKAGEGEVDGEVMVKVMAGDGRGVVCLSLFDDGSIQVCSGLFKSVGVCWSLLESVGIDETR